MIMQVQDKQNFCGLLAGSGMLMDDIIGQCQCVGGGGGEREGGVSWETVTHM